MPKLFTILGYFFHKYGNLKKRLEASYLSASYLNQIKKIGKNVRFNGVSTIIGGDKVELGDNVHIGNNAYIRAEGGLFIGDNTHISRNLILYTHNHNYEGIALPYDNSFKFKRVVIEKNVWIGMNVTILPGTHIMEGAIIGAGSVVTGKVEKCSIVVAPKAKLLSYRNLEHYEQLEKNNKYGGINGEPIS